MTLHTPLASIVETLAAGAAPGTFSTSRQISPAALPFAVHGIGPIGLPISATTARQLVAVARPARYGRGTETLLDRTVRDTWEVAGSQLELDPARWRRTLDPALAQIARELGLSAGSRVRAEVHNLLVYGPGQFFAPHQDSEKADGMFGSLVVLLPSDARGGSLVIEHQGEQATYRGARDRITLVAFYADCRHEVRPVTSGYLLALTVSLFLDGPAARPAPTGRALDA